MTETEMMTLPEMQDLVDKLRVGSGILFSVLQQVYNLHDIAEYGEEDEEVQLICEHCSALSGEVISYPCPTAIILLEEFAPVASPEDQPSTDQSELDEPSDLHQTDAGEL
jgi:hypothetical protein